MKNIIILAVLVISTFAIAACGNTMNGAGRDIERAGQKIQGAF